MGENMADSVIGYVLEVKDKFTQTFNKLNQSISKTDSSFAGITARTKGFTAFGANIFRYFTLPLIGAATYAFHAAEQFKEMGIQFRAITNNAQQAAELLDAVKKMSQKTPIAIAGLAAGAQLLTAYGEKSDQIIPKLKMLSVIAGAYGQSLETVTRRYEYFNTRGSVMLRQLLTLGAAGGAIKTEMLKIAVQHGITAKVFQEALNKGKVSAQLFDMALQNLTRKGGGAYQALQERAHTVSGAFTILNSNLKIYAAAILESFNGTNLLGNSLFRLNNYLDANTKIFQKFMAQHKNLTIMIGGFAALISLAGILAISIRFIAFIFAAFVTPIRAIAFIFAALATPVGAVVIAVAALIALGVILYLKFKPFHDLMQRIWAWAGELFGIFTEIVKKIFNLGDATKTVKLPPISHSIFGGIFGTAMPAVLPTSAARKNESTLNINVHDPSKIVKNIDAKNEGDWKVRFNKGMNMTAALLSSL